MLSMRTVPAATPSISGCPVHGVECRRTRESRLGAPLYARSSNWSWQRRKHTRLTWLQRRRYQVCRGSGGGSSGGEEGEEGGGGGWSLEGQVDKMLGDAESQALIQDLNAAVERVARARIELDNLEEQQRCAGRTESVESLVEECQRDVFAAEDDVKNAEIALVKARAGSSIWDISEVKWKNEEDINEDVERVESGKAAAVTGVVGTLAGLPFFSAVSLDVIELAVSVGFVFASCALFGLTYRYAVRRDLGNTQLKGGCVAAFALVRGLGQIDATRILLGLPEDATEKLFQGCLFGAENIAVFSFAAVSLEYCFRQGLVSPFPLRQ